MSWFYELDGKQCGPVSDAGLDDLLRKGQIHQQTLLWREGMADWQPLASVRSSAGPGLSANPASTTCAECGRAFPADELVSLNKSLVCASCKPLFLQRMAEGVATSGIAGLWREGKRLVTRSETPFPDRCVKCNSPINGFRLKRVLYWHHPAYYLLLLCNLLILLIVVLIVRKKAVLHIGLCESHRKQRLIAIVACTAGLLGGLALIVGGVVNGAGWAIGTGVAVFFTGIIWGIVKGRTIYATKIDKDQVWVAGVCREFLDELPER